MTVKSWEQVPEFAGKPKKQLSGRMPNWMCA